MENNDPIIPALKKWMDGPRSLGFGDLLACYRQIYFRGSMEFGNTDNNDLDMIRAFFHYEEKHGNFSFENFGDGDYPNSSDAKMTSVMDGSTACGELCFLLRQSLRDSRIIQLLKAIKNDDREPNGIVYQWKDISPHDYNLVCQYLPKE